MVDGAGTDDSLNTHVHIPHPQTHAPPPPQVVSAGEVGLLLTASLDGTISLFSHRLKTQQRLYTKQQKEAKKAGGIHSLCYSAKNRWVANTNGRSIYLWDINTEDTVHIISSQPARVLQIALDNRNDLLVGLLSNSLVHCWGTGNLDLRQVIDVRGQAHHNNNKSDRDSSDFVNCMILFENRELVPIQSVREKCARRSMKAENDKKGPSQSNAKMQKNVTKGSKNAKMDVIGDDNDDNEGDEEEQGQEEDEEDAVAQKSHFPRCLGLGGQLLKCWKLAPESVTGMCMCVLHSDFGIDA